MHNPLSEPLLFGPYISTFPATPFVSHAYTILYHSFSSLFFLSVPLLPPPRPSSVSSFSLCPRFFLTPSFALLILSGRDVIRHELRPRRNPRAAICDQEFERLRPSYEGPRENSDLRFLRSHLLASPRAVLHSVFFFLIPAYATAAAATSSTLDLPASIPKGRALH